MDGKPPPIFSEAELQGMRRAITIPMELALFEVLRCTGCRVHEALNIKAEDVDPEHNRVLFTKTKGKVQWRKKTLLNKLHIIKRKYETKNEQRESILDDDAIKAIKAYLSSVNIDSKSRLFPRTTRAIQGMVKRWAAGAGIADMERAHPHTFRHTEATRLLRRGVSPHIIKKTLGWSPKSNLLDTTYGHIVTDDMVDIILKSKK